VEPEGERSNHPDRPRVVCGKTNAGDSIMTSDTGMANSACKVLVAFEVVRARHCAWQAGDFCNAAGSDIALFASIANEAGTSSPQFPKPAVLTG
jgi:hypothetical protein